MDTETGNGDHNPPQYDCSDNGNIVNSDIDPASSSSTISNIAPVEVPHNASNDLDELANAVEGAQTRLVNTLIKVVYSTLFLNSRGSLLLLLVRSEYFFSNLNWIVTDDKPSSNGKRSPGT